MAKRMIGCIVALLMVFSFLPVQFAEAANPILVTPNGDWGFDVTLTEATNGTRYTIQMLDSNLTKILYIGEKVAENGEAAFDTFSVDDETRTGNYIVRIGDNKGNVVYSDPFQFTNVELSKHALRLLSAKLSDLKDESVDCEEATEAINTLSAAASGIMIDYSEELGLNTTFYEADLSAGWKLKVNTFLSLLDLSINDDGSNAGEKVALLQSSFNEAMEIVKIMLSDDGDEIVGLVADSDKVGFEKGIGTYYNAIEDKSIIGTKILDANFEEGIELKKDLLVNTFDGAVLLGVINKLDWKTAKEAIGYYEDKGLITLDYTYYDKISDNNKPTVYKGLKDLGLDDYSLIAGKFLEITKKLSKKENSSSDSGGGDSFSTPVIPSLVEKENVSKPVEDTKKAFVDMKDAQWASEAVEYLKERKIINGRTETTFAPNDGVAREEFAKMVVNAFGLYNKEATSSYTDIEKTAWEYAYVSSASQHGLMQGLGNGSFGKGVMITRQDMAVILHRVLTMRGIKNASSEEKTFTDFSDVSGYAQAAVQKMAQAGVINGMGDGTFKPLETVSRAQAAKVIYEMLRLS